MSFLAKLFPASPQGATAGLGGGAGANRAAATGPVVFQDPPFMPGFLRKIHFNVPTDKLTGRSGWHIYGTAYVDPNHFKLELFFSVLVAGFAAWYLLIRQRNRQRAYAWTREALKELDEEFANVADGPTPYGHGPLIWNGAAEAVLFATGRRNVETFHAFFQFAPIHNLLSLALNAGADAVAGTGTVAKYDRDLLVLTLHLPLLGEPSSAKPAPSENLCGVFALIDKSALRNTKSAARYDLTFGKLLEAQDAATQRGLDERWAILSESADLTDAYLGEIGEKGQQQRDKVGLVAALQKQLASGSSNLLESIVITDQPLVKPEAPVPPQDRHRRIILTLRIPKSAAQVRQTLPLLNLAMDLADGLAPSTPGAPLAPFRADTLARLKRTRAEVDRQLLEESQREAKEAEKEKREKEKLSAAKKKEEGMSEKELERRKEIERKRQLKKQQGKAMKR